jgi:hypothetical protein
VALSIRQSEGFFNAPTISGRYITLQRPQAGWFNLADIQVFSKSGGKNIITPSTVVTMPDPHSTAPLSHFVDGKPDTIIHNASGGTGGPLTVDLGSVVPIFKIVVTNRKDCCRERAVGTILTIQNQSKATIYTSDPITDKSGNNTYTELGGNNDTKQKYYYTFTYFPPNTTVLGDFVDLTMSGPAAPVTKDTKANAKILSSTSSGSAASDSLQTRTFDRQDLSNAAISGTSKEARNLKQRMNILSDVQSLLKRKTLETRRLPCQKKSCDCEHECDCENDCEKEEACPKPSDASQPTPSDASRPKPPSSRTKPSDALSQGQEYKKACDHDMTQYIRKDSIPCWKCNLDY